MKSTNYCDGMVMNTLVLITLSGVILVHGQDHRISVNVETFKQERYCRNMHALNSFKFRVYNTNEKREVTRKYKFL